MLYEVITPPENEAKQFGALVAAGGQWVIIPHVNPDGDAIGACLGLSHILSAAGIESRVVLPDTCPDYLRFIAGSDQMIDYKVQPQIAEDSIKNADVIVWCDFNVRITSYNVCYTTLLRGLRTHRSVLGLDMD